MNLPINATAIKTYLEHIDMRKRLPLIDILEADEATSSNYLTDATKSKDK